MKRQIRQNRWLEMIYQMETIDYGSIDFMLAENVQNQITSKAFEK